MYKKEFTRDFSIIMEEAWHYSILFGIKQLLGLKYAGKSPLVFYYADSTIEVWSDQAAIGKYLKRLDVFSRSHPEMINRILTIYKKKLKAIESFIGQNNKPTRERLSEFVSLLFDIIPYFTISYYIADKSLASPKTRRIADKIRMKDSFYDDADDYIRQSLRSIYPNLIGLETAILKDEISNPPSQKELRRRQHGFVLLPGENIFVGSLDDFSRRHRGYSFNFIKYNSRGSVIKGSIAFSGNIQGQVMVIKNKSEIRLFKRNYILVSPMTTPDYLVAMKKAKAFITDEGGLLCHAAIIAREMKKPCIIGTKIATRVLHDGDLVEVDADKGIVLLLKKK